MLVTNVSLRPPRTAIAADIAEAVEAVDATATGNIEFATLVDDPASVFELVDAYLGEIMAEAASAADDMTAGAAFDAAVDEAVTVVETQDGTVTAAPTGPGSILTGLIGHWDASVTASLTLSGSSIDAVADQSGNGRTLIPQGAAGTRPTYNATGLNSLPSMMFNSGSQQRLGVTLPFGGGSSMTVFFVGVMGAGDIYARALSFTASGSSHDYDNNASFVIHRNASNAELSMSRNNTAAIKAASTSTPHRVIGTISSAGARAIYVDGVATTDSIASAAFGSTGTFVVGGSHLDTSFWRDSIAECGVATGYSDATTAAALDAYLATKWGL